MKPKNCLSCQHMAEQGCDAVCRRLFYREIDDIETMPEWCPLRKKEAALSAGLNPFVQKEPGGEA